MTQFDASNMHIIRVILGISDGVVYFYLNVSVLTPLLRTELVKLCTS